MAADKRQTRLGGHALDPRAVANLILDRSVHHDVEIRHLKLQKLLYFAHGAFLIRTQMPLVAGFFEAWQHGPVHPAVYKAFRNAGAGLINFRADHEDVMTGQRHPIPEIKDPAITIHIDSILSGIGKMSDFDLVKLSHVPRGPWSVVVEEMLGGVALGARIDNTVLAERFAQHKLIIGTTAGHWEGSAEGSRSQLERGIEKPYTSRHRAGK